MCAYVRIAHEVLMPTILGEKNKVVRARRVFKSSMWHRSPFLPLLQPNPALKQHTKHYKIRFPALVRSFVCSLTHLLSLRGAFLIGKRTRFHTSYLLLASGPKCISPMNLLVLWNTFAHMCKLNICLGLVLLPVFATPAGTAAVAAFILLLLLMPLPFLPTHTLTRNAGLENGSKRMLFAYM